MLSFAAKRIWNKVLHSLNWKFLPPPNLGNRAAAMRSAFLPLQSKRKVKLVVIGMKLLCINITSGAKAKKSKAAAKSAEVITTDDEGAGETETEDEAASRPRPKPRAAYRGHQLRNMKNGDTDVDAATPEPELDPILQNGATDMATPRPTHRQRSTLTPLSPAFTDSQTTHEESGALIQSESRKRGRSVESGDEDGLMHSPDDTSADALKIPSMIPSPSQDDGEIQIRRKRVRR